MVTWYAKAIILFLLLDFFITVVGVAKKTSEPEYAGVTALLFSGALLFGLIAGGAI